MNISTLDKGIYSISEAAVYTRMPYQRLYSWFGRGELFHSDYSGSEIEKSISFLDMIDALVACQFRENKSSMQYVRKVYEVLAVDLETSHPFCHQNLYTGSGEVYVKIKDVLSEVLTKQTFDEKVIEEHLKEIDYDPSALLASRWRIAQDVVLDPSIVFGKPVLESTRIPTYVLAKGYYANGKDERFMADMYQLRPRDVMSAVNFERDLGRIQYAA